MKVADLFCAEVKSSTTLFVLLLVNPLIVGETLSTVLIVIVFDLLVTLPAASATTTLTVSLFVEFTVKSL